MMKTRKKLNWKSGNGEMLGFALLLPALVALICCITSATEIALTNQTLLHTAYTACRSAVVCNTVEEGRNNAAICYEMQMGLDNAREHNYAGCTLEVLEGATWEKGAYVKCTVRYYVDVLMPFTSGIKEQSVTMMIENGAGH